MMRTLGVAIIKPPGWQRGGAKDACHAANTRAQARACLAADSQCRQLQTARGKGRVASAHQRQPGHLAKAWKGR